MNSKTSNNPKYKNVVDYDIHGFVGIRCLNPGLQDLKSIENHFGTFRSELIREPEIIIEFVDSINVHQPINYLGSEEFAFTKDAFFITNNNPQSSWIQISFDQIGKQCRILTKKADLPISLLLNIINLTALAKDAVPIHASAFSHGGLGYINTGWSGGGKTGTLLSFMAHGASFISSEYVFISSDGREMYGIPQPIRLRDHHLKFFPEYKKILRPGDKRHLETVRILQSLLSLSGHGAFAKSSVGSIFLKAASKLQKQLYTDISPYELFGRDCVNLISGLNKVFITYKHDKSEIIIRKTEYQGAARRINFMHQFEYSKFMKYYHAFCFAFPDLRNEFVENANNIHFERLNRILADKDVYSVFQSHQMSLSNLFDVMTKNSQVA